jgi:transcriptional regulator with XRE-family HTH domain
MTKTFRELIREKVKLSSLSQKEIAIKVGMEQSRLSHYISGGGISLDKFEVLCEFFGLHLEQHKQPETEPIW